MHNPSFQRTWRDKAAQFRLIQALCLELGTGPEISLCWADYEMEEP